MQIKGLSWLGTRTANFDEMVGFAKNVLELKVIHEEPGVGGGESAQRGTSFARAQATASAWCLGSCLS